MRIICTNNSFPWFRALIPLFQNIAEGLDKNHPFSYTPAASLIVDSATSILESDPITSGYARTIWGLVSNFIAFDHLCATYGVAAVIPRSPIPQSHCEQAAIGTASQVSNFTPS
jgi:hypothetical protein